MLILVLAIGGCVDGFEEEIEPVGSDMEEGGPVVDTEPVVSVEATIGTSIGDSLENVPAQESLEDMSLKLSDFPSSFSEIEGSGVYQRDVSEFTHGDEERIGELTSAGWLENYYVEYVRMSEEVDDVVGKKLILEDYSISLSRYDEEKPFKTFMEESTEENEEWMVEQGYVLLDGEFGDGSVFGEYVDGNLLGYTLQFHVDNIFVNVYAKGRVGDIDKEQVAKYGRILEGRID